MTDNFIDELTDDQKEIFLEFRERLQDKITPQYDDRYLWGFLKARNLNIEKAEKMIRENFRLRDKLHAEKILETYVMPKGFQYFPYHVLGFDVNGNVVVGFLDGRVDAKGVVAATTTYERLMLGLYMMEHLAREIRTESKRTGKYGGKIITVDDLSGISIRALLDRSVVRAVIDFLSFYQNNYPESLKCTYLINAPSAFYTFFNFISRFVDPVTLSKIKVLPPTGWQEILFQDIDPAILPAMYGGTRCDPDGDGQCPSLFPPDLTVPLSLYLKDGFSIQDRNMVKVIVRERTYFNHKVLVTQRNSRLAWSFQTKEYNIAFGIYYVPKEVKPMPEVSMPKFSKSFRHRIRRGSKDGHDNLVPTERVNSHYLPEEGEILCERVGIYMLHFDNTFSWVTPKELHFKAELHLPKSQEK